MTRILDSTLFNQCWQVCFGTQTAASQAERFRRTPHTVRNWREGRTPIPPEAFDIMADELCKKAAEIKEVADMLSRTHPPPASAASARRRSG